VTGTVTSSLLGSPLYGPKSLSIPSLAQQYAIKKANGEETTFCQNLNLGDVITKCSMCTKVSSFDIQNNNLNYCGSFSVNCSSPLNLPPISLPDQCFSINECQLLTCENDCSNAGKCSSLGICECNPGHHSFDCSVYVENNCIHSSYFDETCWTTSFPSCGHLKFQLSDFKTKKKISEKTLRISDLQNENVTDARLILVDRQKIGENQNCDMFVVANEISIIGNELRGCPTLKIECAGLEIDSEKLGCVTLVKSNSLLCSSTSAGGIEISNKIMLIIIATGLLVASVTSFGYFIRKWCFRQDPYVHVSYIDDSNL